MTTMPAPEPHRDDRQMVPRRSLADRFGMGEEWADIELPIEPRRVEARPVT